MEQPDLPLRPSKGNRRRLDMLWLERLEEHGLFAFLQEQPSKQPPELDRAINQFNNHHFWGCHETLEDVWRSSPYPLRHFYQGIIKVAVGFYHLSRHNRKGATNKLSEGRRLLKVFTPEFSGVNTDQLCRDVQTWIARLSRPESIDWKEMDRLARPRIEYLRR